MERRPKGLFLERGQLRQVSKIRWLEVLGFSIFGIELELMTRESGELIVLGVGMLLVWFHLGEHVNVVGSQVILGLVPGEGCSSERRKGRVQSGLVMT